MFSWVLRKAYQKGLVDRESFVAQYLALAVFTTGIASALGADDLLAAFAAGTSKFPPSLAVAQNLPAYGFPLYNIPP